MVGTPRRGARRVLLSVYFRACGFLLLGLATACAGSEAEHAATRDAEIDVGGPQDLAEPSVEDADARDFGVVDSATGDSAELDATLADADTLGGGDGDAERPDEDTVSDVGQDVEDGGDTASGDTVAPPLSFRVLTINLKHPLLGLDEARARLEVVADGIDEWQPDVVALQEVIREDGEPSFAAQLGALTGYEWLWEYTFTVPFSFDEGLGILARWPIVWSASAELPHLDLVVFRRRVLGARLATPVGELPFYCTHMTTDSSESVKADQARAVLDFIRDQSSSAPGFLCGDLNAEPDTLAMRFLRGEAEYEGDTGDLVDAWLAVNPAEAGFTMSASDPTRRIDYIYVTPPTEGRVRAISCETVFTGPQGGAYASDHLGVLCLFEVAGAAPSRRVDAK